jgi:hypothetical protein
MNKKEEDDMADFLYNLSEIYTCNKCKPGFKKYLLNNRPSTCCNKHFKNYINKMEIDIKNNHK